MSLYTDDDVLTQPELLAVDPELADVADAEQISVDGDTGIIRQAWDECADDLLSSIQNFSGDLYAWPGKITAGSFLGVSRPRAKLTQICTSANYSARLSPLRRWMVYRALFLFYRAASNRRESDRYDKKQEQFEKDAKRHWRVLFETGLPVVSQPLPRPGALHELNTGTWGASNVSSVAGGSQGGDVSYDVAITWVDATRYASATNTQNAESAPSDIQTLTVTTDFVIRVSIASLVPPGAIPDQTGSADGLMLPLKASGWNLYVGVSGETMYLQNGSPIPIGTPVFTLPNAPTLSGPTVTTGQAPNYNLTFQKTLKRG